MISERSLDVLRVIVQDYVANNEPVGSKTIVERHDFGVSAATIRNDMASLEEEDLIVAPHTSSGRVPTDKGYRLFVDRLATVRPLSPAQRLAIERFLGESVDVDGVLERTVRLLSQLTHQVALVQYPSAAHSAIRRIEFVSLGPNKVLCVLIAAGGVVEQRVVDLPRDAGEDWLGVVQDRVNGAVHGLEVGDALARLAELAEATGGSDRDAGLALVEAVREQLAVERHDRLVVAGSSNLIRGERDFNGNISPVLDALEEQVVLLRLFSEMEEDRRGVSASIGRENASFGLGEASVLSASYTGTGGRAAHLGVLGPTRMDYTANMAAVRAVARYLSRLFGENI
ncbi:MAG TPA: heat-inducible transcriptional repressor HrcA [Microbacteriaceae bacterium]|nr:heat-inducible transcriptional repressor HrcA [Microbacteriaceae bacterium]